MVGPIAAVVERDSDERQPVPLGGGDERAPGGDGIAGLDTDAALITAQQPVMVGQVALAVRNCLRFAGDDFGEGLVLQRCAGQPRKIVGSGVVVVGRKPVRIGKMRVFQPQLGCALVHHRYKMLHCAARRDGQRRRRVVARFEHQAIQQVGDGDLLALNQINRRALDADRLLRNGDDSLRFQQLDSQQRGHDFGRRRHPQPHVFVSGGEDVAALLHHNVGSGSGSHGVFPIIYARTVDCRGDGRRILRKVGSDQRKKTGCQQKRGQHAG